MTVPGPQGSRGAAAAAAGAGPRRGAAGAGAGTGVRVKVRVPLRRVARAAAVACGVQFGWALQLSLLTPYVQELGVAHAWASLVWLCGPLSGLLVQPLVGHLSDRLGRRRSPFIVGGAATIAFAVITVGFSADIGLALGDPPAATAAPRPRAVAVYVVGFWLLDVGNNATQGPTRALLADLTGKDQRRNRIANAYFSLFMALGNVLGFATGSYSGWFTIFPFTVTSACTINCANLKSAFLLHVILLAITTYISISSIQGVTLPEEEEQQNHSEEAFLWELMGAFRYLTWPVWIVLIVTALTWIGWFPFFLFDTDWMGREIYRGKPDEGQNYHSGVRMGAFGLMLNSVVLGFSSVMLERLCKKWGSGLVWGVANIIMSLCFLAMLVISLVAKSIDYQPSGLPPDGIVVAALIVFAILGAPLAITYSIPYAMVTTRVEPLRLGQGLAMGILNLAIVIPQVIVSLGSGPWDQLFGGGNLPAFAVATAAAFLSGLVAIIGIPRSHITRARGHR
ncbi:sucrose transport protein SUT2 [Ananas comosus]|uniref:Sucrose transport protein SUT2 n=1 Tax=Ananas comosus TaxID=4615 RepID=A0A6P5FVK7_ANACO|nr:sucrose transport protein SUT2 [Ananas comosus]